MYLWSYYSPWMILACSLGAALALWIGTHEVLRKRRSVGELVMFMSYLALFYVPINQIHSVNHMLQHALAASERVFEVLDSETDVKDRPGAIRPTERLKGHVRFEAVSFHYRPDVPVLRDLTLDVEPG